MEYLRSRSDLFSLGSGFTSAMSEITPRRFEKYHIKTYVMLERLKEKKERNTGRCTSKKTGPSFLKTVFVLIHTST